MSASQRTPKGMAQPQQRWPSNTGEGNGLWLRSLRDAWPRVACTLLDQGEVAVVRVLVAEVRGSAPREPGTSMLVTSDGIHGTIGGGNLEWEAMRAAKALLAAGPTTRSVQVRRLVLGHELRQCCGGVVQLWLDRFTADDLPLLRQTAHPAAAILTEVTRDRVIRKLVQGDRELVRGEADQACLRFTSTSDGQATLLERIQTERAALWLFGAGHVAQALVHILGDLPFEVTWIDSRPELLPDGLPSNVHSLCTQTPIGTVSSAPAGARFLVMTHDHSLDYALCRRILERQDFTWLGLIGSKSKGARFRSRFARDGIAPESIARLTCPIGIEGVNSKLPAAIAVAVAAELLRGLESRGAAAVTANVSGIAETKAASAGFATDTEVASDVCTSPDCLTCSAAQLPRGRLARS